MYNWLQNCSFKQLTLKLLPILIEFLRLKKKWFQCKSKWILFLLQPLNKRCFKGAGTMEVQKCRLLFCYLTNGNRPQRVKIFPWIADVLSVTLFGAEAWNPTQFNHFHLCSSKEELLLKTANGEITSKANSALILSCEKYWLHHWGQLTGFVNMIRYCLFLYSS